MRELFLIETSSITRYADIGISQLQDTLASSDGLFWLDIEQMTDEDAAFLTDFKECRFHPLSIAECHGAESRPKINEFPEYLFLVLYGLDDYTQGVTGAMTKLCMFLTPDFLITVHSTPLPFLQQVKDRIEQDYLLMRSPGYCMSMILDAMVEQIESMTKQIEPDMGNIEDTFDPEVIRHINQQKQVGSSLQRTLSAQCDLMHDLITQTYPQMQPETIIQIRGVYHRLAHIMDTLNLHREALIDLRDGTLAGISMRLHGTVRRLTTVATVFLPLMCLAALSGMNANLLDMAPPLGYGIALAVLAVIAVIIALATRRR